VASGLGYSDDTIADLLGRKGRGVTLRYVHRPDQALASAVEAISADVARQLVGENKAPQSHIDAELEFRT
jgi:hypothetical protein